MGIPESIQDEIWKIVTGIIVIIGTAVLTLMKKLPSVIITNRKEHRHIKFIDQASNINNIIDTLAKHSGAIYVHVVHYRNGYKGKKYKANRMTVKYERTGLVCDMCASKCMLEIKRIQDDWDEIEISDYWLSVMEETINLDGRINTIRFDELEPISQSIWKNLHIEVYKEIFIKSINLHSYFTLGLSFCNRFKKFDWAEGMMSLAARQLKTAL